MKKRPTEKQLKRPICRKCEYLIYIHGIPFCKKIAPYFDNETGACKDYKEREKITGQQLSIFDKIIDKSNKP